MAVEELEKTISELKGNLEIFTNKYLTKRMVDRFYGHIEMDFRDVENFNSIRMIIQTLENEFDSVIFKLAYQDLFNAVLKSTFLNEDCLNFIEESVFKLYKSWMTKYDILSLVLKEFEQIFPKISDFLFEKVLPKNMETMDLRDAITKSLGLVLPKLKEAFEKSWGEIVSRELLKQNFENDMNAMVISEIRPGLNDRLGIIEESTSKSTSPTTATHEELPDVPTTPVKTTKTTKKSKSRPVSMEIE